MLNRYAELFTQQKITLPAFNIKTLIHLMQYNWYNEDVM